MSSPAAASPHPPQKPGPGRSLEGLPGIIAFIVVAAVLVVGPKIWTVGEALTSLGRSITGRGPVEVAAPEPPATVGQVVAVSPAASPVKVAPKAQPVEKHAGEKAPAAAQPKASRQPRSRPAAAPTSRPSVPASVPPATATTDAARLQHFYALMDQGIRLYRAGWFGPSVGRFRQATAVMPTSPYAFLWLGRASLAAHRPDYARNALQRVIVLAPDSQAAREASALLKQLAAGSI